MEVQFIGAVRTYGVSKKTKNSYDMYKLFYAAPIKPHNSENYNILGFGSQPKEIDIAPEAFKQFAPFTAGDVVDVKIEADISNLTRNICTGVNS